MHLDVSRHFFSVAEVKRYIDLLATYKFNVFHWHLTDDQGWRIDFKRYPKIREIAAWRDRVGFSQNQAIGLNEDNGKPYGGWYSQDDIREVVAYAKERHITIVPEIDIPGHSQAALIAYPELYCFDEKLESRTTAGISNGIFCAGKEETFTFLEHIFGDVAAPFPQRDHSYRWR